MVKSWDYEANVRRIKIVKDYLNLLRKRHLIPKQASVIVCKKYNVCRKTIYNYLKRFSNMPLRSLE